MKFLKKFFLWFAGLLMLLIIFMYIFNVDYLLKAVRTIYFNGHTTAFLEDYKYFDNRKIETGIAQPWATSKQYNSIKPTAELEKMHQEIGTVAFLIIKNDSIWSESYYDGYNKDSKSNSFSMAKSIVSASLGKAILEGKIKSLDQKVSDFFPEFKEEKSATMTVGDLSSMASGLDWDESYYSPFSITTRAYFDDDLNGVILGLRGVDTPGTSYKYLSGNTQLLAMCVEKAVGKSLADYVSEKFWKPMSAENEALWQTDKEDGIVKAYCCIASNARDFARFGKLYKQNGKWNGVQILDSTFIATSTRPRFADSPEYGYGWWLSDYKNKDIYYMRGHLGQYVIVIPEDDLIIVRLGHQNAKSTNGTVHSDDFYVFLEETYKMLGQKL
ncbi:CubicO group peptidase (beta-lactamase class C family) [Flavobacterium arsenatis]|uniref:CubicO group peptidase (Beta-lactamase class C family) n=1 Tax=Flavobacterium arsenatis TaxID=1484332 RepID=A0ABU1TT92_9FLAO|nr:serine hydrolase [Flavobacterium arsenatis]MDR6969047.1 CubicO group peptidase (beta-lactamase class C family) [Flavobacterium arsenatis]